MKKFFVSLVYSLLTLFIKGVAMIYVFAHQNPDSDSICSALATADWLNIPGKSATPFRLGKITPETAFILQQAEVEVPRLLSEDLSRTLVWLVDFTDAEQGIPSLALSNIVGIIDHHRLGTVMIQNPPDVWDDLFTFH